MRRSPLELFLLLRLLRSKPNRPLAIILLLPFVLLLLTANPGAGHKQLLEDYDKKLAVHDPIVQLDRGRFWYGEGNNAKAKQSYEMIIREFPDFQEIGEVYRTLAFISYNEKDYPKAIEIASKGIEEIKTRKNIWFREDRIKQLSVILRDSQCSLKTQKHCVYGSAL